MKNIGKIVEKLILATWPVGLMAWLLMLTTWIKLELPILGHDTPFLMYFFVVGVAALTAGFRAGVVATVLAAATAHVFFLEPGHPEVVKLGDVLKLSLFMTEGVLISFIVEKERRSRQKLVRSLDELETTRHRLAESNERVTNLLAEVMDKSVSRPVRKPRT
jgi:K+-sensing histidine kinase KdpD